MTPEQREQWMAAYESENQQLLNNMPDGEELAHWKFNRYIKDYLRTIKSVDDGVGRVLDYLDVEGLSGNTIVVYTSDQGFYLGEHGWFDKRFMYEESFRTPLLVRYPREISAGTEIQKLVQNLDFAPTFLDYAGVEIPDDMQGVSFRRLMANDTTQWRDAVYYTYYEYPSVHMVKRHYGVATDRYKLMHFYYDIDEWEMYDLDVDPMEMQNVYDDPEYANIRKMMHEKLEELREHYGDSDELNQKYLKAYLDHMEARRQ
jgi:arylsulfatase A-like enzyme